MNAHNYQYLDGMQLDFVPGSLALRNNTLSYAVKLKLSLDLSKFEETANRYLPDYLLNPINTINPELSRLAYHHS
ncbi:hypothetical protein [Pseudomonas fluorescens]|uniref:hypothetical protein n=1 Tax=Pseudomonas fluorescens TaxID=294 RepID=UPI000F49435E|nr:hypothetical protein [Pseudomonas fluorescens]RON90028.1 hypothetical protein BK668_09985 [Pseudomonas fluorescens]